MVVSACAVVVVSACAVVVVSKAVVVVVTTVGVGGSFSKQDSGWFIYGKKGHT